MSPKLSAAGYLSQCSRQPVPPGRPATVKQLFEFEFKFDSHRALKALVEKCGVVCIVILCSSFDTIPACDRQTDRQRRQPILL